MRIMVTFYRLGCSLRSFSGGDMKDISLERGLECCFIPPDSQKKIQRMLAGQKHPEKCSRKRKKKHQKHASTSKS